MSFTTEQKNSIYAPVAEHIKTYEKEFNRIPDERKTTLKKFASFIETKIKAGEKVELIFICTHNSRRSHISQIWAQTAAAYYSIPNVIAYSGGTEATAFNPRAVKAMEEAGFKISKKSEDINPLYEVRFADDASPIEAYSKKYDADENPKTGFVAIMTCSHADENCPLVLGSALRISTPYDDPKDFDGTSQEVEKYKERVHEIGREVLYAFSLIKIN
jgi:protein-tyrosine-phosphatase